jgi:hypothetical protein
MNLFYTMAGIVVVGITGLFCLMVEVVRNVKMYLAYWLGDVISRTVMRVGVGYGAYNRLMLYSSDLDVDCRLWKPTEYSIKCAGKHQKATKN